MVNTAITILLLPLVAFVLIVFVTRPNKALSAAVSILGMGIAAILWITRRARISTRANTSCRLFLTR